ncbi:MAG: hypothetical protein DMF61_10290 [Blastocatellia bacterium AA13]|nr:MAG: hypothetical protein DMF61_10290 [Blastocatellia bacterium AA13]
MSSLDKIENIVVLMLENRPFDHMLGFLKSQIYPIEGLTGNETIPMDPDDSSSQPVAVNNGANYRGDFNVDPNDDKTFIDPGHEVDSVHQQIFRGASSAQPINEGFVYDYLQQSNKSGPNTPQHAQDIVRCFAPEKLPVLTTLAQEFAVCDHWFSSMPGPTWPNRLFVHAATSAGQTDNSLHEDAYNIDTIYDRLEDANFSWRIYFHDFPQSLALVHLQQDFVVKHRYKLFGDFLDDARTGRLPAYSFIEPRYTDFLALKANDQHPPHDAALGEHLIADVYEAVRNSPQWEKSLLVLLWDEHGGIYDHVPPPQTVNPDGKVSLQPACDFTRLGVRVPCVLVSPYIAGGTIDSQVYDHTSLLATVEKRFGLLPLTNRDAQANTFESIFSIATPRTDAPTQLQRPTDPISQTAYDDSKTKLADMEAAAVRNSLRAGQFAGVSASDFQTSLVRLTKHLTIQEEDSISQTLRLAQWSEREHDAAMQVRDFATRFFKHLF